MTVAAILERKGKSILSARADERVAEVVARLAEQRIGAMPVLDEVGRVSGIISERDIIYGLAREGAALLARSVGEVMTSPVVTVSPTTPLLSALAVMTNRRIRHLPVIEGEALVGFISIGDLVKLRIDRIEAEAEAMRHYIAGN
ncbi:CBS domain-containing protein [Sphingomonas morindae]|uniref:CBS domain-containing protein n=1 Tax=Sphingomonas morindae TaxID=1541170 RepID=A0ABY4XBK3_9SPHN|nr:CBS domain-containing protein [Sphingomonas morindae]USI74136.1 CBS domain-containing protein [Sphingomonas morindae]